MANKCAGPMPGTIPVTTPAVQAAKKMYKVVKSIWVFLNKKLLTQK
jgi:hypothetical protein